MNGVHDMGGMHGMGPIQYEKNEPVFHARWEGAGVRAERARWAPGASGTSTPARHRDRAHSRRPNICA